MATARLLIIAPDSNLRQSLEFVLEAEGYAVVSHAMIDEVAGPDGFDCIILDHQAVRDWDNDAEAFFQRARRIVLLTSAAQPRHAEQVFRLVQKPLLGEPLATAVKEALDSLLRTPPQ